MRILVVQPRPIERDAIAKALAGQSHEVEYASDAAAALHVLEHGGIDAVIVEHVMAGMTGHELVRRLRAREADRHTWVVVMNSLPTPGCVRGAFDAGADDYVVGRCSKEELLARLDGRHRVETWLKLVATSDAVVPRADATRAWQDAVELMTSTFGDMLGVPVSIGELTAAPSDRVAIAALPLTLVSTGQEVTVRVAVLGSSLDVVSERLLGQVGAPGAETRDMVREIANLAGGVWKRLAAIEGHAYSLGLPRDAASWQDVPQRW